MYHTTKLFPICNLNIFSEDLLTFWLLADVTMGYFDFIRRFPASYHAYRNFKGGLSILLINKPANMEKSLHCVWWYRPKALLGQQIPLHYQIHLWQLDHSSFPADIILIARTIDIKQCLNDSWGNSRLGKWLSLSAASDRFYFMQAIGMGDDIWTKINKNSSTDGWIRESVSSVRKNNSFSIVT